MPIALHVADYVVFGLLLFVSALFGPFFAWKERCKRATSESYFAGSRSLHIVPTSASLFASFWSAIAMVGVPLELYTGGAKYFMASVGQAIGFVLAAVLAVPMLYKLQLISSFEYFELRFRSVFLRKLGTIFNILATACYLAVVTFAPGVALEVVSPIPAWVSIIVTASVTMLYTVLGGIKAVVWVDLLQAVIMFAGVVVSIVTGFQSIDGGFTRAMELAYDGERLNFFDFNPDLTNNYNFWVMIIPYIFGRTGLYVTSQPAVQRYSALPTVKQAIWSVIMMAPQILVLKVLLFLLALAMFSYYADQGCDPLRGKLLNNPNQLTTFYVANILRYPGLVGIWFSALFSGSLSTMSTGYNSMAACIWEDLLKGPLEPKLTPRQVSVVLKIIPFLLGVLTCGLSIFFNLYLTGGVVKIYSTTVLVLGTAVYIAFFNGALFPFTNTLGTAVGMVVATAVILFITSGQMAFKLAHEQVWLTTTTHNCEAMMQSLIDSGKYVPDEISDKILGKPSMVKAVPTAAMLLTASPLGVILANRASNGTLPLGPNSSNLLSRDLSSHANISQISQEFGSLVRNKVVDLRANKTSHDEAKPWEVLPAPLLYLFSISYFTFPFLSLLIGVVVAVLISLCSGGLKTAKTVDPRFLIVKNCFYEGENTPKKAIDGSETNRRLDNELEDNPRPWDGMEYVDEDTHNNTRDGDNFEDDANHADPGQQPLPNNMIENEADARMLDVRRQGVAMELWPFIAYRQSRR